jgi:hypothetical protein
MGAPLWTATQNGHPGAARPTPLKITMHARDPYAEPLRSKNNVLPLAKIGIGQSRTHTRSTNMVTR